MDNLVEKYKQELLTLLVQAPKFENQDIRDILLNGILGGNMIQRSTEKAVDLLYIIQYSIEISKEFALLSSKNLPLDILYENIVLYLPPGNSLGNNIQQLYILLRTELLPKASKPVNPRRPENYIPFTNREDEIKAIMKSDWQHKYIDAPAGYGKTALLLELKHEYEEKGFLVAYGELNSLHNTVSDVASQLFSSLDVTPPQFTGPDANDARLLAEALGKVIRQYVENIAQSNTCNGFILMIDKLLYFYIFI